MRIIITITIIIIIIIIIIIPFFLSNLEKATKELEPEKELISPQILYPVFAASLIGNLVMGGHILSQVENSRDDFYKYFLQFSPRIP